MFYYTPVVASKNKLATVAERILLYLWGFKSYSDELDGPAELTQAGIAEAVGINRGNIGRAMTPLHSKGFVDINKMHVVGIRMKRNIYYLSGTGRQAARGLRDKLLHTEIRVTDFQGKAEIRGIEELLRTAPFKIDMLDVVMTVNENHEFDYRSYRARDTIGDSRIPEQLAKYTDIGHFHGRVREMAALSEWLERADCRSIVISGLPGIGKSTLVSKFLCDVPEPSVLYFKIFPWSNLRSLLSTLSAHLAALGNRELKGYLDKTPQPVMSEVDYIMSKGTLDKGLFLILDDYHNATKDLTEFISMMHQTTWDRLKIAVIGRHIEPFYDRRDAAIRGSVIELNITGLDEDDARALARDVGMDGKDIPTHLARADGHPLFIELMARGHFDMAENDIERFIKEEFVSSLGKAEQSLLGYLSVFRYPVHRSAVRTKQLSMSKLIEKSLLKMSPGDYLILHDLIKSSIYSQLSESQLIKYHAGAAEHYLESFSFDSQLEALYHLMRSDQLDQVKELLLAKDPDFFITGRSGELIRILAALLGRLRNIPGRKKAKLLYHQAELLSRAGEWDAAVEHYQRASGLLPDSITESLLRNKLGIAKILLNRNNYAASQEILEEILGHSGDHHDIISEASYNLGVINERYGDASEALKNFNISLEHASIAGGQKQLAEANYGLGRIYHRKAEYDKSLSSKRKALDLALAAGDNHTAAKVLIGIGWTIFEMGDLDEAIKANDRAIELARKNGAVRLLAYALSNAGAAHLEMPDLGRSYANLRESLMIFEKLGEKRMVATVKLNMAINALMKNDSDDAERYFDECVDILMTLKEKVELMTAYFKYGQTLKMTQGPEEAKGLLHEALRLSEELNDAQTREMIREELDI